MYNNFKNFFNKGKDQKFCDNIAKFLLVEIKLKSGEINEDILLQCDKITNLVYNGEHFTNANTIKNGIPKSALAELKKLVAEGSKLNFENDAQIKNWVILQTGILSGAFSS